MNLPLALLEPLYKTKNKNNLLLKNRFKKAGIIFGTMSKIFISFTGVISFASWAYQIRFLSFLAGISSITSLIFLQVSLKFYSESKKIKLNLNLDEEILPNSFQSLPMSIPIPSLPPSLFIPSLQPSLFIPSLPISIPAS